MINFEYYNEQTGEKLGVNLPNSEENNGNKKEKSNIFYIDYYSENLLDWTASKTFNEIIEAYEDDKNVVARSTVEAQNFEGVEIEAQTRLLRLHKITSERVEFIDVDFKDGDMETIKVTHTIDNIITIRSLVVH